MLVFDQTSVRVASGTELGWNTISGELEAAEKAKTMVCSIKPFNTGEEFEWTRFVVA